MLHEDRNKKGQNCGCDNFSEEGHGGRVECIIFFHIFLPYYSTQRSSSVAENSLLITKRNNGKAERARCKTIISVLHSPRLDTKEGISSKRSEIPHWRHFDSMC